MAGDSYQEKTEKPTPKRREEARKKGQVAKSRELPSIAVLISCLFCLTWGSSFFLHQLSLIVRYYLSQAGDINIDQANVSFLSILVTKQVAIILAPLFIVITLIAIFSNIVQTGPLFSLEAAAPKFSHINPIEGFKRLFSFQALNELLKSMFKIFVVGWICYKTVKDQLFNLIPLMDQTPYQIMAFMGHVSFLMFWRTMIAMIFMAALDYAFQRWQFEKDLRMTKEEVKEEFKQTEGDPMVKSRIRSIQREMARKRMMSSVPEADVVITNPTHLAVALKYEAEKMEAPKVIAKGSGLIAQRIKDIAKKHSVPVIENPPLAQSLYKLVEVGQQIPESLYKAVAEVLAYVYKLKKKV